MNCAKTWNWNRRLDSDDGVKGGKGSAISSLYPYRLFISFLFFLLVAVTFCGQAGAAAPTLTVPATSNLGAGQVTLTLTSSETGTGYFTILSPSESVGTATQTKNGQNAAGTTTRHGSLSLTAATAGVYTVRNLAASTTYTIVFTAADGAGTLQNTVNTATVTTSAVASPSGSWGNVGLANFSAGQADYTSMAVAPDGTPYVAVPGLWQLLQGHGNEV